MNEKAVQNTLLSGCRSTLPRNWSSRPRKEVFAISFLSNHPRIPAHKYWFPNHWGIPTRKKWFLDALYPRTRWHYRVTQSRNRLPCSRGLPEYLVWWRRKTEIGSKRADSNTFLTLLLRGSNIACGTLICRSWTGKYQQWVWGKRTCM